MVAVAFCFSLNSDVSMLFRRHGIFSEMIITHDIRCITKRPDATLSQQQRELIFQIGRINPHFSRDSDLTTTNIQSRDVKFGGDLLDKVHIECEPVLTLKT